VFYFGIFRYCDLPSRFIFYRSVTGLPPLPFPQRTKNGWRSVCHRTTAFDAAPSLLLFHFRTSGACPFTKRVIFWQKRQLEGRGRQTRPVKLALEWVGTKNLSKQRGNQLIPTLSLGSNVTEKCSTCCSTPPGSAYVYFTGRIRQRQNRTMPMPLYILTHTRQFM
jgi:hypothetical protein